MNRGVLIGEVLHRPETREKSVCLVEVSFFQLEVVYESSTCSNQSTVYMYTCILILISNLDQAKGHLVISCCIYSSNHVAHTTVNLTKIPFKQWCVLKPSA